MQALPHIYTVSTQGSPEGLVTLSSPGVPTLDTAPPAEFGGPGDEWSPETLFAGAVADCFILSFRAVARAGKLQWQSLRCDTEAVLDRVERVTRFTEMTLKVELTVADGTDLEQAEKLLKKAKAVCLITNSLNCECALEISINAL